jgi:hypothetical protein
MSEQQIVKGTEVKFTSKREEKQGKVVKVYNENNKTYCKINCNNKYYFKQIQKVELCN